jgi:hypothetical protein
MRAPVDNASLDQGQLSLVALFLQRIRVNV